MTFEHIDVEDGAPVPPDQIPAALTAAELRFEDGASQVFTTDGKTTYMEQGRPSKGTWYVEGQAFCSFWPPSYTGCYDINWLVEAGAVTGIRFIDQQSGTRYVGRYQR